MNTTLLKILSTLLIIISSLVMNAQEHTHSHDEEGTDNAHQTSGMFAVYAESRKYELTLKHAKIEPGKESDLTLYVADFMTNRPVSDVSIKLSVQENPSIVIESEAHDAGIYHLHGKFPEAKPYSLAVNLDSKELGADLLLLTNVEVGKEPPVDEVVEAEHQHANSDWWKFALVFLGGLGVGYLFLRGRPKVAVSVIMVISFHALIQEVNAHGGHDEKKSTAGNSVLIPKETQFLFNILTQSIAAGDFQPSVELFATVVPSPGGYADITTPQSGKVTSLNVTPGQKVSAGQTLAVIRPTTSLSEQVGVATETGRLRADINAAQAELNAAEREMNRLRSIADIAAKKDVQAAEARYNAAKSNLQSLRSIASGSVTGTSGTLILKAPVAGTIGQFSLSQGAEIIAGTTLFSVINLDKVYLEAQVYGGEAALVKNASTFQVVSANDQRQTGQVRMISAGLEINLSNQSQKALFELSNPEGQLKIGEFVKVLAFLPKTDKQIFVPNSALSEISGKPVIFVKENPEVYTVRYVSLGEDNGTHSVVLDGVDPGVRFVVEGTYQVKMMMLNQ